MPDPRTIRIAVVVFLEVAIFGIVASAVLALHAGFPLGKLTPWWIAEYIAAFGVTQSVWRAAGFGAAAAALALALWFVGPAQVDFGTSRFARWGEVGRAGLFGSSGVLLGKLWWRFLCSDEPLHVLVAAPTRSGKGVGIVIPNLLSWHGSAVVMDIKYENHALSSGFRETHGQRVFRFSPADASGRSHRYNPLDAVRSELGHRVSDLWRLAAILLPGGIERRDAFWQEEARALFVGLALYVLDTKDVPHTLGEIYRTLVTREPLVEVCQHLLRKRDDLDPVCTQALGSYVNKSEKERSGVRSTLTAALGLWANPIIDAATSASDFDLADLRRRPTTIYVAVSLDQISSVMRILNLFFQQAVTLLAQSTPGTDEPVPVLFLLDEFASLGRMDALTDSLAFLAGYGVRVCTIVQGLGQLDHLYGRTGREAILQNSALQVFFAANDESTARYVSERLGTQTIRTVSRNVPGGGRLASKTYGFAGRALLLPEEVRGLGPEEALLFKEGVQPVRGQKIRYYGDAAFAERRNQPAAEVPKLEIVSRPAPRFTELVQAPEAGKTESPVPPKVDPPSC